MNTIDRYLAKVVLLNTVLVLLILVALDRLFAFVRQLDDIGQDGYDFNQLVLNIALRIPNSVYEMMSTAVLLGALLGLGALANNSELIVIRSVGMSLVRIARPLVFVGIVLATAVFSLGEWVVPQSEAYASRLRLNTAAQGISIKGASGLWLREGERFINVQRVLPGLNLRGVNIYEYRGNTLLKLVRANSANYHPEKGWQLKQVETSRFEEGELFVEQYASQQQRTLLNPDVLHALSLQPEMLSASELYENVRYLKQNQLQSSTYELAFWSKLSVPVSSIVMFLIALPFVFGSQRVSSGGQRIFVGSLIGVGFLLLSKVSSQLGLVFGLHGFFGAFFPVILVGVVGFFGVRRVA